MAKNSKKAKARRAREKRALEQERLKSGNTTANKQAAQRQAARAMAAKRHGRASNAYANVAGMGAATIGQIRLFRLMNIFSIIGALSLAAAIGLAVCSASDDWSSAVLTFLGYSGISSDLGSPATLTLAESAFCMAMGLFSLFIAGTGRSWLRGDGTFRRFVTVSEVGGAIAVGWCVCCFFMARVIEPVSSICVIVFLVMMSTIMRLHRERPQ